MTATPENHRARTKLPHVPPAWVKPTDLFFVTICCVPRGKNQLCHDSIAKMIFEAVEFRQQRRDWHVTLLVLMPDHRHMLVAFPFDFSMSKVVTSWKSLLARKGGIAWQRDFFDHRIRNHENWEQKAGYSRENPVRAGLVTRSSGWKYTGESSVGGPGGPPYPLTSFPSDSC